MTSTLDWLSGGGEMGKLIRAMDWSKTALGPVDGWPQSLRTTVSLCLSSTFPILIAWGPERVQIYNDTYQPICGEKHPQSMGQPFNECWASALPAVGHIVDRAQAGEGSYLENLPMFLDRYGYLEEAFMTFSFSPIRDESGGVGGLFHPITEVTEKMLSARRTHGLRALSSQLARAKSLEEIGQALVETYSELELDLPFVAYHEFSGEQTSACIAAAGLGTDVVAWPIDEVRTSGQVLQLDDADVRIGERCGPYAEIPNTALLIPIQPPGVATAMGCLVAGVSSRRALDPAYRAFYEQLAATVTAAVASVIAYEQEQRRAEALAEIDRAKTAFFSNVSHEFRTPLTLMLGPLEDALDDGANPLTNAQRERTLLVRRSGLRLLKLVNTLLDFSRIEAGRTQASYEETDLSALTRDLASVFRSTVERAGIKLRVECETSVGPTWVDREMWEKIVLNLLSNAFKHTFEGAITVRLARVGEHVELTVTDTGVGIAAHELPRLFERFHRVQGGRGRSYEGSGIGLALVQELVKLHGGTVTAQSELERGTTFTVSLPLGFAHLPSDRLNAGRSTISTAVRAEAFVDEASGWSEGEKGEPRARTSLLPSRTDAERGRVLLADDNADMRDYVRRTLHDRYVVEAVPDGIAALEATRAQLPDVIVSDVMMPNLDGFGLLRELKADPATASVPVILLSARAGEEATLEGLAAGASDYMVKPFSARELAARVEGAIRTAQAQRTIDHERAHLRAVLAALTEGVIFQDPDGVVRDANHAAGRVLGVDDEQLHGRTGSDARWQTIFEDGTDAKSEDRAPMIALQTRQPVVGQVLGVRNAEAGEGIRWLRVNAQPVFESDGTLSGVVSSFSDITAERRLARKDRERAEFEQQLIGIVSHDLRTPLNAVVLGSNMLLSRADLDESTLKVVNRVRNSADRATRLVRDLLDFTHARLGSGIPLTRNSVDLGLCVQLSLEELRTAFPEGEIEFASSGALQGDWDADRIAQIVHNLVGNAIKYGDPHRPVTVRLQGLEREALLEVHNEGEPISAELLPEIFKPFRRGSNVTGSRARSIGLGLFIVDHLVQAHGGSITVQSTREQGTTFALRLPHA